MHHSFPNTDQYFWPDILSGFPPSPAPSTGTPQMQLDLYDPTSTTFYQNSFKELENFSAPPCTNYSTPPGRGDVWNASSQLYYVNPRPPGRPATQNPPGQQLVFGDNHPHYSFDMDSLFSANKDHSSAPIAPITVHDPPAPPRFLPLPPPPKNQTSYPQSGQLEGRNSLTCPIPSEPVSKSDDAFRKEDSRATAPLPKRQPSQRASDRSSKKRKAVKDAKIVRAFFISHSRPNAESFRVQRVCFLAAWW